jgi:amidase
MSDQPWMWSALNTAAKVRRGDVSAVEVITSQLARLDSVNGNVNAVTRRNDESALAAAANLDDERALGREIGPLAGVALTIKDSADVAGQSTPNGVAAMNARLATADAPAVAHLRAAGAIVIGRTNAPEFSWRWHTDNPLFGPTINPWDPLLTPGGSSGGAAAALAVGIGALAHGSDAGGSLRWPAACCGVSTIRPTQNRVASHNTTSDGERSPALDLMAVHGPMARSVADVRMMLEVMAQPSWRDPSQVPVPFNFERARTGRVLVAVGISTDPVVEATVREAVLRLTDAGWSVQEIEPPFLVEAAQLWARMLNTDFDHTTRARMVELGSPTLRQMLEVLQDYSGGAGIDSYVAGFGRRLSILREWQRLLIEEADVLLMPVTRGLTWRAGADEDRASLEQIVVSQEPLTSINFLGLPSAAQPVHVVDGMPISVQLVAARFNEASALAAAEAIESRGRIGYQTLWSNPSW